VRWVSPLAEDNFAEYRDASFLVRLGLEALTPNLREFWPARGPQWDALGVFDGGIVLVEAKAHIREFFSPPTTASGRSLEQIRVAFALTRASLGASEKSAWESSFYQYANRIAHLDFLRRNKANAHPDIRGLPWRRGHEGACISCNVGGRVPDGGFCIGLAEAA
jgi:hypothetical protein